MIDKKWLQAVQRVIVTNIRRDRVRAIDWKEVGSTGNGPHIDNLWGWFPTLPLQQHGPHSCVRIRLITTAYKPVDICAWIMNMLIIKENKSKTRAITIPSIPGRLSSRTTKTVSQRGFSYQEGTERILSWHIPPVPLRSLGARNVARAEWWTHIQPWNSGRLDLKLELLEMEVGLSMEEMNLWTAKGRSGSWMESVRSYRDCGYAVSVWALVR